MRSKNRISRPALAAFLAAVAVWGQSGATSTSADPLVPLQQAAARKSADWEALGIGLEIKLARMLPCDPRVRASIEEVSRASDARLAALAQYLRAASAKARTDAAGIQRVLAGLASTAKEGETEKAESEQDQAAIEGLTAGLAESAKRRESLVEAKSKLAGIAAGTAERYTRAQEQIARWQFLAAALRVLGSNYENRQKALETEVSALVIETSRWSEYYTARLARAQTECAVTNPSTGPSRSQPAPQRKKQ